MSKQARNRGMFFGCWSPDAIVASAKVLIGDSTGITAAELESAGLSTFGTKVNGKSDEYTFLYVEGKWVLNGEEVDPSAYGLSLTGAPAAGDIVVVYYTGAATTGWEPLGKDNDDLKKELNPAIEQFKNVLGEAGVTHSGYEPEIGVDPYYIDPARKMYRRIRDNAIEENFGESDLKGYLAEAYFETANKETGKMTGYCYVREALYVPQSTGGNTSGLAVPVNIYPKGGKEKKKIVYDMATNEATISDLT